MKVFVSISIAVLFLAGSILLLFPISWFPAFYDVRYMGFAGISGALIIYFLPNVFRVSSDTKDADEKNRVADLFQCLLAVLLMSNALGDLGLYQLYRYGFEFDKFIHFTSSCISAALLPTIVHRRFGIRFIYAALSMFIFAVVFGVFWEVYEYAADLFLGTRIFGVYHLDINIDTRNDIIFNTLGAFIGIFWAYLRSGTTSVNKE